MSRRMFQEFLASSDTLRIYKDGGAVLVFASNRGGLLALIEYIDEFAADHRGVVVLDKVMGNAAALLSVKAGSQEVYGPLGSRFAVATLEQYGIRHHLDHVVSYIQQAYGAGMCPLEKLSIGKSPEEFYTLIKGMLNKPWTGQQGYRERGLGKSPLPLLYHDEECHCDSSLSLQLLPLFHGIHTVNSPCWWHGL